MINGFCHFHFVTHLLLSDFFFQICLNIFKTIDNMDSLLSSFFQKEKLNLDNIVCLQGHVNYTKIYLLDRRPIMVAKTLKYFERTFVGTQLNRFYRPNKTFIINLDQVQSVEEINNVVLVELTNNIRLPISRRKKKDFIKLREIN